MAVSPIVAGPAPLLSWLAERRSKEIFRSLPVDSLVMRVRLPDGSIERVTYDRPEPGARTPKK